MSSETQEDKEVTYNNDGSVGIKYPNGDYVVSDEANQQVLAFTAAGLSIRDLGSQDSFKQSPDKDISMHFSSESYDLSLTFSNRVYLINGTFGDFPVRYFFDESGHCLR